MYYVKSAQTSDNQSRSRSTDKNSHSTSGMPIHPILVRASSIHEVKDVWV